MRRTDGIHAGGRKTLPERQKMTTEAFYVDLLTRYEHSTQIELAEHYKASRACISKYIKEAQEARANGK